MDIKKAVKFTKGRLTLLQKLDETLENLVVFDLIPNNEYSQYMEELLKEVEEQFGYVVLQQFIRLHNGIEYDENDYPENVNSWER